MRKGPLQAVYYESKAYVDAIANEVAGTGVTVTALCPGAVVSGFQKAGDLDGVGMWDRAVSARSAAECGYAAMEKGELLVCNEAMLKFALNSVVPLLPRKFALKMSRMAMEKRR